MSSLEEPLAPTNNNIRPPSRMRRDKSRSSSKLKWNNVSTPADGPAQNPSLKVEDYEPGFALRKIALHYEKNENEQVAKLINNLSTETLNKIYPDFPIEMFIDGVPRSLCIIHNLYSRVFLENPKNFPTTTLPLNSLIMQIVKMYARSLSKDLPKLNNWERQEAQCKNLLKIIACVDGVAILKMLRHRRRCLNRALEGLGEHGMVEVETTPMGEEEIKSELLPMAPALRVELERMITNCKKSIQKLNRTNRSLSEQDPESPQSPMERVQSIFATIDGNKPEKSPPSELPSHCNHQRLMQLSSTNIQDRLYKNKAVLNVIEPTLNYAQLPRLVSVLQERIEKDKDLLLTFSQLRKEIASVPGDAKLAPSLNHYSQAFGSVIEVLKEFVPDDPGTPETYSTGEFRSESGSNQSPTKSSLASPSHNGSADFDLEERKQTSASDSSPESTSGAAIVRTPRRSQSFEAVATLRKECDRLRHELHRSQKAAEKLKQREKELVGRLSRQAQRSFDGGSESFEEITDGFIRPSELARNFRNLYSDGRLQALDALDESWTSGENDTVKSKLLFSVMVLSFRSASDTLDKIRHQLREIMCASRVLADPKKELVVNEVENSFNSYLRRTTQNYDISENVEDVLEQICQALYDRPGLAQSAAFRSYIQECVQLSWSIAVQTPPLLLEYDATSYEEHKHDRFHTSDRASDLIVSYLWPSLLEKQSGKCVAKGIVITGV